MDILRDEDEQRYIYLSGRLNYGSEALGRFNVILSQLPATVVRPREARGSRPGPERRPQRAPPRPGART